MIFLKNCPDLVKIIYTFFIFYLHIRDRHDTEISIIKKEDRPLYNLLTTPVNVEEFFEGRYTFGDIMWQSFTDGRIRPVDQLHPIISIIETEPLGCRKVVEVVGFYVLWKKPRVEDGSRWVTLEDKSSVLPSAVHPVKKYYASIGINYGNSWLDLDKPDDLDDTVPEFTPNEIADLVASVARRTVENTVSDEMRDALFSTHAMEGDDLLPGEGEVDTDDFENDCDDRPDTTEAEKLVEMKSEMLVDLKAIFYEIHKIKVMTTNSHIKWTPELKIQRKRFDKKYACLSKRPYKWFSSKHRDDFEFT